MCQTPDRWGLPIPAATTHTELVVRPINQQTKKAKLQSIMEPPIISLTQTSQPTKNMPIRQPNELINQLTIQAAIQISISQPKLYAV